MCLSHTIDTITHHEAMRIVGYRTPIQMSIITSIHVLFQVAFSTASKNSQDRYGYLRMINA